VTRFFTFGFLTLDFYFSISNQMETKVFLNLVEFKICWPHYFLQHKKQMYTKEETKRKNFEKTFIFFRTKNTTKM